MVGGGAAAQSCPMILRGFLRAEGLKKLGGGHRNLAVLRPIREFDTLGVGEAFAELEGLRPLVGLFNDVEARRWQ